MKKAAAPTTASIGCSKKHRNLIDAEFALNEGARGVLVNGKRVENDIGLAEKQFVNLRWEVRNKGGHSARPVRDNAIYHLADALDRLADLRFRLPSERHHPRVFPAGREDRLGHVGRGHGPRGRWRSRGDAARGRILRRH